MLQTWTFLISQNVLHCLLLHPSRIVLMNCCGLASLWAYTTGCSVLSWASSSKNNVLGLLLRETWLERMSLPKRLQRVAPFYHPSIYQLSTLEETKLCYHPTLSSVLSTSCQQIACGDGQARFLGRCPQRVAPFDHVSQLSLSRDSDFQSFSSPDFLTPKMTGLRKLLQSDSPLVLTLLWLFLHLILFAFFLTSLQNKL